MTPTSIKTHSARIRRHLRKLAEIDSDIAQALELVGFPEPRVRSQGFDVFVHTVISQQLSVAAAESIWRRFTAKFDPLTPERVSRARTATLRGLGLSARKVEYVKGVARAFTTGYLEADELQALSDEEVIERITALKGFGIWSAEIYLMFSLQRPDVFAADDLALQIGLQHLKKLSDRPSAKTCRKMTESWRPHRSAASLLLWRYYSHVKQEQLRAKQSPLKS